MAEAFVVEDGSGLSNANSFVTVAEADDFWELRNNATWEALSDEAKQAAVIRATEYLCQFDSMYPGYRRTIGQSLSWPRIGACYVDGEWIPDGTVPPEIKKACFELAYKASSSELTPDIDYSTAVRRQRVGKIEVEYFNKGPSSKIYPIVSVHLSRILQFTSTARVYRG